MAKKIIWTKRAYQNFNRVVEYLQKEWGERVTHQFINQTIELIEIISEQPEIGTLENREKNIRGFLLTKHNLIFY